MRGSGRSGFWAEQQSRRKLFANFHVQRTNISTGDRVEVEYEARGMVHRPLGLQSMAAAVDFLDCNVAWRKMCAFPALLGLSARGGFRVVTSA